MADSREKSTWNIDIPWQTGTDEDFKDLREQLDKVKIGDTSNKENAGDSDSDTLTESDHDYYEEGDVDQNKLLERFHNQYEEHGSESEDDPGEEDDPGPTEQDKRILWAAQYNKLDLLGLMITEKPSLLGVKDEDGYTALHRASYSGNTQAVRLLLNAGADPAAVTDEGWTPLHSASRWNCSDCVQLLLSFGAPLNQTTRGGQTALHLAAFGTNNRETLELLLTQPGLDGTLVNSQGDTARDVAERNGLLGQLFDAIFPSSVHQYKEEL